MALIVHLLILSIYKGGNYLIPCYLTAVTLPMSNGIDFYSEKLLFGRNGGERIKNVY